MRMGFPVLPFMSWVCKLSLPANVTSRWWNHQFESRASGDNHFHHRFQHPLHPHTFEPAVKTFNKQFFMNQQWKWHCKNVSIIVNTILSIIMYSKCYMRQSLIPPQIFHWSFHISVWCISRRKKWPNLWSESP